jgi:hypothetical protein
LTKKGREGKHNISYAERSARNFGQRWTKEREATAERLKTRGTGICLRKRRTVTRNQFLEIRETD